ncbi:MAG: EutN/CcmL family microcompartment protein [Bacilli bacterium]|nr:EutN/CcmL family microcompartment protein [Bacilli bacterium]
MIVGKVIGSVVSTRKMNSLVGSKLMVVEPLSATEGPKEKIIAIDNIGAGIGETVLLATGSAARIGSNMPDSPIDAAIVGIIDDEIGLKGANLY